jgi:hypothetical protein
MIGNIFFFRELGPFLEKNTLFHGEGALVLRELGPFPKKNSILLGQVVFFIKKFFLLHMEFAWD